MTNKIFIAFFLVIIFYNARGQKSVRDKIHFEVDTFKSRDKIINRQDSAYFNLDGGFKKDTVTIIIDEKLKSKGVFETEFSTGYAGFIAVPKTKKMIITIKVNGQIFQSFSFNKNFTVVHLNYYDRKLQLTYTDNVYIYE